MCNTWRNPGKIEEEITPEIIDKITGVYKRLNVVSLNMITKSKI
jgi:hypothetical protein